ncbi:von Willebrand factor D and EGF domain-containing protein-like [Argopecten irradians]|uniref:von Willebrand factor D and EGF domain-containing protein-like n=1 Tax=Argopecten irradians TaxID=31199 RepID=UPI00371E1C1C
MFGFQVWLFLVLLVLVTPEDDPCHPDHHDTIDEDWRSPSYTAPSGSEYCDATIREGWYRHLGGNMPTTAPNMNRCGTSYPIWMNDNLPTSTVTTDVKVCIKTIFSDCSFHWNIRVKKCDQFYVYYLKQATLCSSAYCFAGAVVCSECGEAPNVTLVAEVTPGLHNTSFNYYGRPAVLKGIVFLCKLRSEDNSDLQDYLYDVQWFINDNTITIHRNIRYANLTQAGLNQMEWSGKYVLGFQVKCAVRARTKTDSTPTPYTYSDDFFAGFKTDAHTYSLQEDGETNINVGLTIPIDCVYLENSTQYPLDDVEKNCIVTIRTKIPSHYDDNGNLACTLGGVTDEPVSFRNDNCMLTFKYNEWNTTKTIKVYGSADGIISTHNTKTSYIRLKADVFPHSPAWTGATMPDIKLQLFDEDQKLSGKTCCIQTDPHVNTFDNRHILFNQSGEFIVFKHEFLPVRIHVILDWCWQRWRGACMCGVAIRYHNAVYVLNLCKEDIGSKWLKSSKVNRYAELRACDDSIMQVELKNGIFKVTLPHGTTIDLGLHIGTLNIHINMFILRPTLVDW